jgi:hypothetical protein
MNSRWFSFQGSTIKRVSQMENEKLRAILKELGQTRDQGRNADHLLWLIKRLQRQQALGPPASRARSPSVEILRVARAVEKYLHCTQRDLEEKPSVPSTHSTSGGRLHCPKCQHSIWKATIVIADYNQVGDITLDCKSCGESLQVNVQ